MSNPSTQDASASTLRPLRDDVADLLRSPRELWIVFSAKFLESLGIMSMLYTLPLWLSNDYALSDVDAGWWVGSFNLTVSLITFGIGFFADAWGFRRTLILAFALSALSRGTMAFAPSRAVALAGLMTLTLGYAGGVPVLNTAVRRYTYATSRSFAFSLYYVIFNVAAAVAGLLVDAARGAFRQPKLIALPLVGEVSVSAFRAIYAAGLLCGAAAFACSLLLRNDVDLEQPRKRIEPSFGVAAMFLWSMGVVSLLVLVQLSGELSGHALGRAFYLKAFAASAGLSGGGVLWLRRSGLFEATPKRDEPTPPEGPAAPHEANARSPLRVALEVMRERAFWRFMLLISLLVFVKLIFSHAHFTFPKYALRELGQRFPLGVVQAVNPILIIVLVPVASALTRHRSAFSVIVLGSIVTALAPFVLAFGASWMTILGMTVVLSIGECLWSPRLYEYTAMIAPRGREASYMGLSSLPMFFAKMAVGPLSGYLLANYCPEYGSVAHSVTVYGADVRAAGVGDANPHSPTLSLVSPPRLGREVELAVAPGLGHGRRLARCDDGAGEKLFESTPSAAPTLSVFGVRADRPGTREVRCVTVDEEGRESAPVVESFGVGTSQRTLGAPLVRAPHETTTGVPLEVTVASAVEVNDTSVRVRCLAPGVGGEASQAFVSPPMAAGTPVRATFTFATAGQKSIYCTAFDDAGGASERRSGLLWLVIGAMTLAGPLLLLGLRRAIEGTNGTTDERPVG